MKKIDGKNHTKNLFNIPQPLLNMAIKTDIQKESISVQLSESDPHYIKPNKKFKSIKSLGEKREDESHIAILKQKIASLIADH